MVIVRLKGGIGNQLFQYAAGYSLARRLNTNLYLDTSYYPKQSLRGYKLNCLKIDYFTESNDLKVGFWSALVKNKYAGKILRLLNIRYIKSLFQENVLLETRSKVVPEFFKIHKGNIFLEGYFQSERYFVEYSDDLRKMFTTKYLENENVKMIKAEIERPNTVAIHVRRGDYLKVQHDRNPRSYLLSEVYYHNAIAYINSKIQNPVFFWFSDDIKWVKNTFGEKDNYKYVSIDSEHPDVDELMLMSTANHIIAANSTFSWWASWLNNKSNSLHICPAKRYGNEEMIPFNWIKIDVE